MDYSVVRPLTGYVVSLWYRPPELFLDARFYESGCDIWSMGCIFGEMLKRTPLFTGSTDLQVLSHIVTVLGSPTVNNWTNFDQPFPNLNC